MWNVSGVECVHGVFRVDRRTILQSVSKSELLGDLVETVRRNNFVAAHTLFRLFSELEEKGNKQE
jgi:hypothetical protein